jgi:hypothetical protein
VCRLLIRRRQTALICKCSRFECMVRKFSFPLRPILIGNRKDNRMRERVYFTKPPCSTKLWATPFSKPVQPQCYQLDNCKKKTVCKQLAINNILIRFVWRTFVFNAFHRFQATRIKPPSLLLAYKNTASLQYTCINEHIFHFRASNSTTQVPPRAGGGRRSCLGWHKGMCLVKPFYTGHLRFYSNPASLTRWPIYRKQCH